MAVGSKLHLLCPEAEKEWPRAAAAGTVGKPGYFAYPGQGRQQTAKPRYRVRGRDGERRRQRASQMQEQEHGLDPRQRCLAGYRHIRRRRQHDPSRRWHRLGRKLADHDQG